jgi:hypothetical protein
MGKYSNAFFSETTNMIKAKLSMNVHWMVLYNLKGHLGFPIGIKNRNFVEDLPVIIPGQFGFNCPTTNMIKAKLYMNVHWMILYKL